MQRVLNGYLSLFLICGGSSFACWCGPAGPASSYVKGASIVFVGKVVFNDDDRSGKFNQKTLVRFEVEEAYKGLKSEDRDVWVDPGSFTSCYATYYVGERYLVFAYRAGLPPPDTASITVVPENKQSTTKPAPPGFDPKNPPRVYLAPECSGSRQITSRTNESVAHELEYLRGYKTRCGGTPSMFALKALSLNCY
jgi:hypothetical protein